MTTCPVCLEPLDEADGVSTAAGGPYHPACTRLPRGAAAAARIEELERRIAELETPPD